MSDASDLAAIRTAAIVIHSKLDHARAVDALLERIGGKELVLLGEASHGTHEFYALRALVTKRLIRDKGFDAVAIEGDWPDCDRVRRYVIGRSQDRDARQALGGFHRFPTWMWRNTEVEEFVAWLKDHNEARHPKNRVGMFGLDLYSLFASRDAVVSYLDKVDPDAAKRARERYACFDHFGGDSERYGLESGLHLGPSCEEHVTAQLLEMQRNGFSNETADATTTPGKAIELSFFSAEQNARVVKNAEHYYRQMFGRRSVTWNVRDTHMMDTIDAVRERLSTLLGRPAKIAVWAHNSHLGDARATSMALAGELNVGQLARERHGSKVFSIGFTTHRGFVSAAGDWDGTVERRAVTPALPGSWEALFSAAALPAFVLFSSDPHLEEALSRSRLERAIGVVYRPETERQSHYFEARIGKQFDAIFHIDETRALEPLEPGEKWRDGDLPETYPFAV